MKTMTIMELKFGFLQNDIHKICIIWQLMYQIAKKSLSLVSCNGIDS